MILKYLAIVIASLSIVAGWWYWSAPSNVKVTDQTIAFTTEAPVTELEAVFSRHHIVGVSGEAFLKTPLSERMVIGFDVVGVLWAHTDASIKLPNGYVLKVLSNHGDHLLCATENGGEVWVLKSMVDVIK